MAEKRGYTNEEAMAYVGVKRRTWEAEWRPRLVGIPQGSSLVFDRQDLDRLFDEFKSKAAGGDAANDPAADDVAQNGPRNGRPSQQKGATAWARKQPASTEPAIAGKSTSGGEVPDFASVASSLTKKRKAG